GMRASFGREMTLYILPSHGITESLIGCRYTTLPARLLLSGSGEHAPFEFKVLIDKCFCQGWRCRIQQMPAQVSAPSRNGNRSEIIRSLRHEIGHTEVQAGNVGGADVLQVGVP